MPDDGQFTRPISDEERAFIKKHKDDLVPIARRSRPNPLDTLRRDLAAGVRPYLADEGRNDVIADVLAGVLLETLATTPEQRPAVLNLLGYDEVTCREAADRIDTLEAALRKIADTGLMIHATPRRIAREALGQTDA
jgi:hypothetical protein